MDILILFLAVCALAVGAGLLTALAIWLRLIFGLLDLLVQQVPRGVWLFLALAYSLAVGLIKTTRYLWLRVRPGLKAAALRTYVWCFVWGYHIREWYVANEIRNRKV